MKRLLIPATTLTTLKKIAFTLLCCAVLMVFAAPAETLQQIKADPGTNEGPPVGSILDLANPPQAIPGGGSDTYQQYTVSFTATVANTLCTSGICTTAITFAFREDPAFISFANASVIDTTTESGNLLLNGDFSLGTVGSTPIDWTYANQYGAEAGGTVQSSCGVGSDGTYGVGNCWYDGAVQAYDAISQTITTTIGDTYQITFWVADNSGCSTDGGPPCNFSDLSTNGDTTDPGGNGINVAVYAQAGLPPPPPPGETLTLTELGQGSGTVTDNLEEINCSLVEGSQTGTCTANYPSGTAVTLTATANPPSTFGGWGGACASFGTTSTCSVTMNSPQNVTAIFNVAGPTQVGTVMTGTETVLSFEGGFAVGGYDYNAELTTGSPVTAQVTTIPIVDQTTCNSIVNASFPGAQCFVYQKADESGANRPVMFELTCPGSQGGTCGSNGTPNFLATLGTDFNFTSALNPFNPNEPLVGWLKGVGPYPLHPCTQNPGNYPPLFQSNQISSFSTGGDPTGTAKGSSGGTGSCWLLTYSTPYEAPSVNVVAPVNGGTYQQGQVTHANYSCTTVNNGITAPTGPYLTQTSCSATDTPGGSVAQGAQFDTTALGPHTFTATVVDSAMNTVSQTVTYNVVAATDLAILNLAPPTVPTGSKLTYLIGVGDLGTATAVNVSVNDTLPPGTSFLSASGTNIACSIVNKKLNCTTTPVPCTFASGAVSCNVGTVMPLSLYALNGAIIQITVKVTATPGTKKNPTVLTDTATVSAANADSKPGNNSSTARTTVIAY